MGKSYLSRLYLVPLPDGMVRITYDDPGEAFIARPIDVKGPQPIMVPTVPVTVEEADKWEWDLLQAGFTFPGGHSREVGLPPVEELETYEEAAARAKVATELLWLTAKGSKVALGVTVRNVGPVAIPALSVHYVYENESPQADGPEGAMYRAVGGSYSLSPVGPVPATLGILETHLFAGGIGVMMSRAASLSPERFRIAVRCGDYQIATIDGAALGAFLDSKPGT